MKEIKYPESYEICRFDGIRSSAVYRGTFDALMPANGELTWRRETLENGDSFMVLTLKEIADQLPGSMITVFCISPLSGIVLQYGNYGKSWWEVGVLDGYA